MNAKICAWESGRLGLEDHSPIPARFVPCVKPLLGHRSNLGCCAISASSRGLDGIHQHRVDSTTSVSSFLKRLGRLKDNARVTLARARIHLSTEDTMRFSNSMVRRIRA